MQDEHSVLQSFVTIKPAAEKILSDGTDVDGTAKYRRAKTESLVYLSELSFHHTRESVPGIWQFSSHYIVWKTSQTLDVGGGIFTSLSLEIQFKHTFNSSIL